MSAPEAQPRAPGFFKIPQDFAAGLFLLALAAIAFTGTIDLTFGKMSGVGAGMMPRTASLVVAAFGVLLILQSIFVTGSPFERWSVRGPFFVLGSALIFAWTIRPLGLVVAGPISVMFCALADRDSRPLEIVVYAVVLTAACIGMFHYLLGLPMPIMPTTMPYPLNLWIELPR